MRSKRLLAMFGGRVHHFDHGADDVARGAELSVDAGGVELGEDVFVEVALGVGPLQRQERNLLNSGNQQTGLIDHKLGVFEVAPHPVGCGQVLFDEREHLVADRFDHFIR